MDTRKIILSTAAYPVIVLPLAILWHLVLFEGTYSQLGYIARDEPIFAFGISSMIIQGYLLAIIFPYFLKQMPKQKAVFTCFGVMWLYSWTFHVLAAAAKQPLDPLSTWFMIETAYLLIQFGLVGFAYSLIYHESTEPLQPTG